MASNTTLNSGAGGDVIATKERTHDGDATKVQVVTLAGVSGSEGSYTFGDIGGDATNGLDVDVTRCALPTGASTSANQTTIIGHLDGVEGLLTTIDADTGAILTSLQTIDNAIAGNEMQVDIVSGGIAGKVDDAAFTAATDEGVLFMGVVTSDSVDSGDAGAVAMTAARALHVAVQSIAAGNNNIGDVDVASIAAGTNTIGNVGLVGRTTGGLSIFRSLDLDETEEDIKTSAGQLYFIHAMNLANGVRYLKLYNATAANVTVGTTTPVLTFPLPTMGDTNGAGFTVSIPQGLAFGTAISAAVTTGLADNDTGAPGASEVVVNIGYT